MYLAGDRSEALISCPCDIPFYDRKQSCSVLKRRGDSGKQEGPLAAGGAAGGSEYIDTLIWRPCVPAREGLT